MAQRNAKAAWRGGLKSGDGSVELGSGSFRGKYSFKSRFESGTGTNPEELIGAAHAACFSMALAHGLEEAGYSPESIETSAKVSIEPVDGGFSITRIQLDTQGTVPDIDEDEFLKQAEIAKDNCPVSKALAGVKIDMNAALVSLVRD
ncbi:MAG: OsmC family protein [Phycisphaerales bacterium]|jgi:osmotically inducible protein OsmC